jgi:DNA anti-recombination protein RmuC
MISGSVYTIIGILLTFSIFLANVIYRTGHLSARVEEIERWRTNIRQDMHEISEKLEEVGNTLKYLATLIEERTERGTNIREH